MTMDGQDVTKMVGLRENLRFGYQTVRDERLYREAWFSDFRERFRAALSDARIAGRLNALNLKGG